ncbi:MAG: molybdenum cofactor guanylyltransferase [Deltaproteobacteria bacterium]|nr:molybdenum cofactor guanylyltransferase [Deltaproteobacteria bacterium]
MRQDKAFIQVGGTRLFDYVYGRCQELFSEIIIVTNRGQRFGDYQALTVIDEIPGAGPLGGLYTGLLWASNYHTFCVACDMPFLCTELIAHLLETRFNYDVVIPITRDGLEPLHALYSKRCIGPIKRLLERGEFKIARFFPEVRVRYCEEEELKRLDPSLASFININTKRDFLKMQEVLKGGEWEEKLKAY